MFLNNYEYFKGPDSPLYKAKTNNYIGVDGYRVGARFEATASSAGHHIDILLERLGDPDEISEYEDYHSTS